MATIISKKENTNKTSITINSRVTFRGCLPGGYWDNYSGYSKMGPIYGTVVKMKRVNCIVRTKDGSEYEARISELTNIEDLF
jgi:hypothetical protein